MNLTVLRGCGLNHSHQFLKRRIQQFQHRTIILSETKTMQQNQRYHLVLKLPTMQIDHGSRLALVEQDILQLTPFAVLHFHPFSTKLALVLEVFWFRILGAYLARWQMALITCKFFFCYRYLFLTTPKKAWTNYRRLRRLLHARLDFFPRCRI